MTKLLNFFTKARYYLLDSPGIQVKLMGIYLFTALFFSIWTTYYTQSVLEVYFRNQLQTQGVAVARNLANQSLTAIITEDNYSLNQLIQELKANNENVRYVFIVDSEGKIIANSFGEGIPKGLKELNENLHGQEYSVQVIETQEGLMWDIAMPVTASQIATVRLGMAEAGLGYVVSNIVRNILFSIIFITFFAAMIVYMLQKTITTPLLELVAATKQVAAGNLGYQISKHFAQDEAGQLVQAFNSMTEKLQQNHQEMQENENLRKLLLNKVITIQEDERKRIARELHDETSQCLTGLKFEIKSLENLVSEQQDKERIQQIHRHLGEALESIHDLIVELRPKILDDQGLWSSIKNYLEDFQEKFMIKTNLELSDLDEIKLLPEVTIAVFRIVQESLTNVVKYAAASEVKVIFARQPNCLTLMIEDNGVGFDVNNVLSSPLEKRKLGIFGMRERADLMGGSLSIDSAAGEGTTVYLRLPLKRIMEEAGGND
jgi:signal transduction histidine kinase